MVHDQAHVVDAPEGFFFSSRIFCNPPWQAKRSFLEGRRCVLFQHAFDFVRPRLGRTSVVRHVKGPGSELTVDRTLRANSDQVLPRMSW